MMIPSKYREFLLQNLPEAKPASGFSEVVCKCFYCADDGDHHHMYVSVPQTENEPSLFNCFKCGTKGMVTYKKLAEWQIFDMEMNSLLTEHNKNLMNGSNYGIIYGDKIINLRNTFIRNDTTSRIKLSYINDRLGINLSFADCLDNKIILNLKDLLYDNWIQNFTRSENMINELDSKFVGFLSYDNNFVNCRKIDDSSWIDQRYMNYNIFGKQDNTKKMYLLPTDIDIYRPIHIHVAEGPFDILSIKYNLRKDNNNQIYTAITGNAYKAVFRELIINRKLINLIIHLYPDADTKDKSIRDLLNFLKVWNFPIFIHRNLIGKDMGVSINQIQESIDQIM